MFPLLTVPSYQNLLMDTSISESDSVVVFYATLGSILSGAVYGDHVSPISDTTVLSSLATDCNLLAHVSTQIPYATFASILGILLGTIPIGNTAYPNWVAIILGAACIFAFVFLYTSPIVNATGKFDFFTELLMKVRNKAEDEDPLAQLREDTTRYYEAGGSTGTSNVHHPEDVTNKTTSSAVVNSDMGEDDVQETV